MELNSEILQIVVSSHDGKTGFPKMKSGRNCWNAWELESRLDGNTERRIYFFAFRLRWYCKVKLLLCIPWRHGGGVGVQLHSFVTICSWVVRFTSPPLCPHRRSRCYSLRRLAGFKGRSQRFEKSLSLPGIETWFFGCPHLSQVTNSYIGKRVT